MNRHALTTLLIVTLMVTTAYSSEPSGVGLKRQRSSDSPASPATPHYENQLQLSPASEAELKKFRTILHQHQLPDSALSPSNQARKTEQLARHAVIAATLAPLMHRDTLSVVLAYLRTVAYVDRIQRWPLRPEIGMHADQVEITDVDDTGQVSLVTYPESVASKKPFVHKILIGPKADDLQMATMQLDPQRFYVSSLGGGGKNSYNNYLPITDEQAGITRIFSIANGNAVGQPLTLHDVGKLGVTSALLLPPLEGSAQDDEQNNFSTNNRVVAIDKNGLYCMVRSGLFWVIEQHVTTYLSSLEWHSVSASTGYIEPLFQHSYATGQDIAVRGEHLLTSQTPPCAIIEGQIKMLDGFSIGSLPAGSVPFHFDQNKNIWYALRDGFLINATSGHRQDLFKDIPTARMLQGHTTPLSHQITSPERGYSLAIPMSATLQASALYFLHHHPSIPLTTPPKPVALHTSPTEAIDCHELNVIASENGTKCALKTKDALIVFHLDGCD